MRTVRIARINGNLLMLLEEHGQVIHIIPADVAHAKDWIDDGYAPTYFLRLDKK